MQSPVVALAERRQLEPKAAWQGLVRQRFKGRMKGPFNDEARTAAGFPATFYQPLAAAAKDGTG